MSQNTVAITLLAEGTTLNLVGVGDSLCFHCLELLKPALSPVDSDEPRSHHPLQSSLALPPLLSCSAAGCQEMSASAELLVATSSVKLWYFSQFWVGKFCDF